MSTTQWHSKVVPARLAFLAIYNPSLGPTDDTFHDQLVFYYSRAAYEARIASKKDARNDSAGEDAIRNEENEKLRQIGLAQGMVDFATSFSNSEPVDSIETDRSRIVLQELEKGWWILASVDLTQLPSIASSSSSRKGGEKVESQLTVEYSSREVSPPALLLQQLLQAHYIFCLHHGPSLSDLFVRLSREKFCSALDRYWTRFSRSWDVLLHGNPAADIFSGLKLASGGELGYGVGEEEWGSGERAVLEDIKHRTEGMVDLLVARFGDAASDEGDKAASEDGDLPWMGSGAQPVASDGIIFGGVGTLERYSIRDLSLWMRHIYTFGEHAYGVRDNPLRERRKRRRRNPHTTAKATNGDFDSSQATSQKQSATKQSQDSNHKESEHGNVLEDQPSSALAENRETQTDVNVASNDGTTSVGETLGLPDDDGRPNIPPPIVSGVEQSLANATKQVDKTDYEQAAKEGDGTDEASTTLGIPDQYMKYLTFGLSTLGKGASTKRPSASRQTSSAPSKPPQPQAKDSLLKIFSQAEQDEDGPMLTHLEPIPDGETLKSKIANLKRRENNGHFLVGLRDDLDALPEDADAEMTDVSTNDNDEGSRIVLRTIQAEIIPKNDAEQSDDDFTEPPAAEDESDNSPTKNSQRLRVLVYVHRPFVYCFLFENRTSSLSYTSFYKSLHQNLRPIHKGLLLSTDVTTVTQRIESSHAAPSETESANSSTNKLPSKGTNSSPIFDLIYDPRLLTLHTSIPNIPEPGTPAAEGIFSSLKAETTPPSQLTRIEALNIHSQILNTLQSARGRRNDIERTSKTSRGWWVVWMKVPPSTSREAEEETEAAAEETLPSDKHVEISGEEMTITHVPAARRDLHRIAFLVRKASDAPASAASKPSGSGRTVSSMFGNMGLGLGGREEERTTADSRAGPAITGGIGVDARRYVEGLLSLNR